MSVANKNYVHGKVNDVLYSDTSANEDNSFRNHITEEEETYTE